MMATSKQRSLSSGDFLLLSAHTVDGQNESTLSAVGTQARFLTWSSLSLGSDPSFALWVIETSNNSLSDDIGPKSPDAEEDEELSNKIVYGGLIRLRHHLSGFYLSTDPQLDHETGMRRVHLMESSRPHTSQSLWSLIPSSKARAYGDVVLHSDAILLRHCDSNLYLWLPGPSSMDSGLRRLTSNDIAERTSSLFGASVWLSEMASGVRVSAWSVGCDHRLLNVRCPCAAFYSFCSIDFVAVWRPFDVACATTTARCIVLH